MSYCRHQLGPIPEDTAKLAKALSKGKHSRFVLLEKLMVEALAEVDLEEYFSNAGPWGIHPVRVCMLLLLQTMDGLTDKQAVEAVQYNIGWKYVLHLELDHLGWNATVLTDARERFEANPLKVFLDSVLAKAKEKGLLDVSKQRMDSTQILAHVKSLNRIELVLETNRNVLEELTDVDFEWLRSISLDHWMKTYYLERPFNYRLPKKESERTRIAESAGADGFYILDCIENAPGEKRETLITLDSVKTLKKVLEEQFDTDGETKGKRKKRTIKLKDSKNLAPSGERIVSPHEPDARAASKGSKDWTGYRCHTAETCVENLPKLITHVQTEVATLNDSMSLDDILKSMRKRGLIPGRLWLDGGYVNVDVFAKWKKTLGIDFVARLVNGHSWQSKAGKGFDNKNFTIDWKYRTVTCPSQAESVQWKQQSNGEANVYFSAEDCSRCPFKTDCAKGMFRILHLKPKAIWKYMQKMRQRQGTVEFKEEYSIRAGVEGLQSQLIRIHGRRTSVRSTIKTNLKLVLAAAAVNFSRLIDWENGKKSSRTRRGKFELATAGAA
jgi:transposase